MMLSVPLFKSIVTLMVVDFALSQTPGNNITASTCADPGGYTTCLQPVTVIGTRCAAQASDASGLLACACDEAISEIACALANCWNVVYGCEYQSLASQIIAVCFGQGIPFFPAPENAPGGCSCNLGHVVYNMSAVATQYNTCVQQSSGNISRLTACGCCYAAGEYTSKYSICPNTNPLLDGFPGDLAIIQAAVPQFSSCSSTFQQYNCVQDLGFPPIGSIPYLSALPQSTGTATLSTLQGTISSPLSSGTFVLTASWDQMVSSTIITEAGVTGSANSYASAKSTATSSSSEPASSTAAANSAKAKTQSRTLGIVSLIFGLLMVFMTC